MTSQPATAHFETQLNDSLVGRLTAIRNAMFARDCL